MLDYEDWINDFSFNLEAIMREEGISQKELAERIESTRATISRYLSCKQEPTLSSAINIANALNCDLEDLVETTELIKRRM